ncbi:MAG: dehydrogenase subunit, partial [Steroidobacteraceae bacterium]|nr:dehydrogenase subunit [Steroidobacteraceae bacterium]
PFAGFFSKDEILWSAYASTRGSFGLWLVGSAASFLTAFYMFRAVFLTFFGASRVDTRVAHHVHEPPPTMSVVLAVLALGSVVAGLVGLPELWRHWFGVSAPFYDLVEPVVGHVALREGVGHSTELALMAVAVAVALGGIALAWLRYGRGGAARESAAKPNALRNLVSHGYYFDGFYEHVVVRFTDWLSEAVLARRVEARIARVSLERPARFGGRATALLSRVQTGDLQAYVIYALIGLAVVLGLGVATHG